jgi:DNA-binding winged helix-turn-helix (wHTH) protein/tetratricopeptide (TPR) repeat protein
MDRHASRIYEFKEFRLIPAERLLLKNGGPVPLTHKVFDILWLLVRHSGQLIEKEEMLEAVWPEQFVEEHNLTVSMSALRKALGESHDKHQYIETVPKHGYRFIANVRELAGDHAVRESREMSLHLPNDEALVSPNHIHSLAVLPFVNVGAEFSAEYLCDGITESIITSLSQLSQLRVMAYSTVFRYKGIYVDPQEVGRCLGVRSVVVGRVSQRDGNLTIRTELVDVMTGWQLWGEHYDREPAAVLAVQHEIAKEISENLRLCLTGEQKKLLAKRHTESTEAYHLYLKGRYNWNKRTPSGTERAVEYFEQAIREDPEYALAYAGLADSYNLMAGNSGLPPRETFPKARAAAVKALEIDNTLAEAHTSLALVRYLFDWDWSAAEVGFQCAIELNPNYATAHHWYGEYLVLSRRFDKGFQELIQAQELDPLSLPIHADIGQYYFFTRQYQRAVEQLTRALDLEPHFVRALALLGWTFEQMGRFKEAIAKFEQATALSGSRTLIVAGLGHAHAVSGNREEALKILAALKEQASRLYVSPYEIAVIHAALQENEQAFECLEQACDDHSVWLSWLEVDPRLDTLRADVRFEKLLGSVRNG